MSRIRSVEGDRYRNFRLRKLGMLARFVFGYLCDDAADDEGRMELHAESVLDALFPRGDDVTLEQVSEALASLRRAKFLAVYRVGGITYGFLTGWFEHQWPQNPRPSSLPVPPENCAAITTRAQAERVKQLYSEAHNTAARAAWIKDAVRWWTDRGLAEHGQITQSGLSVNSQLTDSQLPVNLSPPLPSPPHPSPSPSEGDARAGGLPDDLPMVLMNHPGLRAALDKHCSSWPPGDRQRFLLGLLAILNDRDGAGKSKCRFSEPDLERLLREHPPDRADKPESWYRRMAGKAGAVERDKGPRTPVPHSQFEERKG